MSDKTFYDFKVKDNKKQEVDLGQYKGKVVVVVNVASQCGFTPQYKGLQALYEKYKDQGLEILGFPCNQFGGQEPGSNEEIEQFCSRNYSVSFPVMDKIDVNGDDEAPLYHWLKENKKQLGMRRIKWNFEKFVVNKEGQVVSRYSSLTTPADLEKEVDSLLKQ